MKQINDNTFIFSGEELLRELLIDYNCQLSCDIEMESFLDWCSAARNIDLNKTYKTDANLINWDEVNVN